MKTAFAEEAAGGAPQDAERNRELLEIWKDHVKTLTKERNEAYKEIERLKTERPPMAAGAPMAQFGAIETQPIPNPAQAQQIENLQSEVSRLQGALEQQNQANAAAPTREFQRQFSAMQTQLQDLRKELSEQRAEKDRLIQEKEKALSQVDRMKEELETVQAAPAPSVADGQDQDVADNLQKALNIQKKRYDDLQNQYTVLQADMESLRSTKSGGSEDAGEVRDLQSQLAALKVENAHLKGQARTPAAATTEGSNEALRQAREMQYENETLRARIEKLQAVEKELTSTRAYFTPLTKDLQENNEKLSTEVESLRATAKQAQQIAAQNSQLSSELQSLRSEQEEAANQINAMKSQLQMAAADREKFQSVEQEAQRLTAENKSLNDAYTQIKQELQTQEQQFREATTQYSTLQKANQELQARDAQRAKEIEAYRTKLQGNLQDMKNLKSNFESYLESLVASFDERRS